MKIIAGTARSMGVTVEGLEMARGKKYRASSAKYDRAEQYPIEKAIDLVKEMAYAKFDETVEVSMKLNIKSKHTIRDVITLSPHRFGKEKSVLVFAKGDKAEEARKAGAAYVGDNDLIEKIKGGWLDFDIAVANCRHDERRREARPNPGASRPHAQPKNADRHIQHQRGAGGTEEGSCGVPRGQGRRCSPCRWQARHGKGSDQGERRVVHL